MDPLIQHPPQEAAGRRRSARAGGSGSPSHRTKGSIT
ncbi:hypothetical protein MXAN_4934 [Myxococcus xanthus DK 1622]|uniref:Uncharacterized protein n=1 Tax=Myxococcus xanthus (strain DK1622) TaxID=246197 RepID=Q1D2N3_MYXXD|nr:hypothetical protein MXAN_4934 [Myxococcus xanthus DK 1622]